MRLDRPAKNRSKSPRAGRVSVAECAGEQSRPLARADVFGDVYPLPLTTYAATHLAAEPVNRESLYFGDFEQPAVDALNVRCFTEPHEVSVT